MRFTANLADVAADPVTWATEREAEGWGGLSTSDHYWERDKPFPHWAVTLTQLAMATTTPVITSSFGNNLLRSPVEFAQAALALQRASGGRFEAGLGAGWFAAELVQTGQPYPGPGERAARYREAMTIVRTLVRGEACRFEGDHYDVDVPALGPAVEEPPPLVASVGSPRTIREVTPLVDRVELNPASPATRGGNLDHATLATIDHGHLGRLVEQVRAVREDVPIGVFLIVGAGDHERVRFMADALRGSLTGSLVGDARAVAERLLALEEVGISSAQLTPVAPGTFEALAPLLRR